MLNMEGLTQINIIKQLLEHPLDDMMRQLRWKTRYIKLGMIFSSFKLHYWAYVQVFKFLLKKKKNYLNLKKKILPFNYNYFFFSLFFFKQNKQSSSSKYALLLPFGDIGFFHFSFSFIFVKYMDILEQLP